MEEKKKNKTLIVIIAVISLLVIGTGTYFAYDKIFKKDKPVEENQDNKDKVDSDITNSTILKSLVDVGYIQEYDNYDSNIFKINDDKKLIATYYDEEEDKYVTKTYDEIDNVVKIIPYGQGEGHIIVFTESNDIYSIYAFDTDKTINKIDNYTGKKLKGIYRTQMSLEFYVCFDDDSLIKLNLDDYKLENNIRDINLFIGGLDVMNYQCGSICLPSSVKVYGDGSILYVSEISEDKSARSDSDRYSKVKYNDEILDLKYIGYDNKSENMYFITEDNDVYFISNYFSGNDSEYVNTKIEKAKYKFETLKSSNKTNEYDYDVTVYIIKFSDGTSKTFDNDYFIDLTSSYFTTIFNLYK